MLQDIYDNLLYKIDLTMFEDGIEKTTLITFHYYLKVLESYAQMYLDERGVTNIKRAKNPLELFLKDLYYIISKNPELTKNMTKYSYQAIPKILHHKSQF